MNNNTTALIIALITFIITLPRIAWKINEWAKK